MSGAKVIRNSNFPLSSIDERGLRTENPKLPLSSIDERGLRTENSNFHSQVLMNVDFEQKTPKLPLSSIDERGLRTETQTSTLNY